MIIQMVVAGNDVIMTLDNVIDGSNSGQVKWDAENQVLVLLGIQGKWLVMKEHGVTLL